MKYKIGDKVIIKSWEEITNGHVVHHAHPASDKYLNKDYSNRIILVDRVIGDYCYRVYGNPWNWFDYMIECSLEKSEKLGINNRFEILDL